MRLLACIWAACGTHSINAPCTSAVSKRYTRELEVRHCAGGPTGIAGSGAGGGCGVGLGLGWGYGSALGAHYIVVKPEFEKDLAVKPMWRKKLDNALSHVPIPFPGKPAREV